MAFLRVKEIWPCSFWSSWTDRTTVPTIRFIKDLAFNFCNKQVEMKQLQCMKENNIKNDNIMLFISR